MATLRVGDEGATVFDSEGRPVRRLRPGWVVVDGTPEAPGSLADQHQRLAKRQRGYADKAIHPPEDKG